MRFVIDLDSLEVIESASDRRKVTQVEGKRGDDSPFEVVFVRNGVAEELAASSELTFGAKQEGRYDAAAVVLESGFALSGSGPTAVYSANPSFNTVALNALFLIDGNEANDPAYVDLMAEFTWKVGSGAPTSTKTFRFRVHNDVVRGDELTPTPAPEVIGSTAVDLNGSPWVSRDSSRAWTSVASSANGAKLVATVNNGQIYTSTDSGATWTARDSNRGWRDVCSSADGGTLAACVEFSGRIYTSTDSGATWTARDSNRWWKTIACSTDGTKMVAGAGGGQISTSADSGATWTAREASRDWTAAASSADGTKLVAAVSVSGQIYTSADSGATWTARENNRNWRDVACSADGSRIVAVAASAQIYVSTDSGATWAARETVRDWLTVLMSPTGQKMLATANVDGDTSVYYSSDYGGSWEQVTAAPDLNYRGFAASEDWTKLAAAPLNGTLYTVAITNLLATAAPPYIRTAGGFLYVQEAGVWKKTALSAL
jgi:photosystem II stability/assembly factor-like uncharacterized protein